jgi:hypothetical protein
VHDATLLMGEEEGRLLVGERDEAHGESRRDGGECALAAAADYIDAAWHAQGYVPERETFTVNGVNCANLVIPRPTDHRDTDLQIGTARR